VAAVLALLAAACGSDSNATASSTPVDPAGVWTFAFKNTRATGVCASENGDESTETITITKAGTKEPYPVTAKGFLGSASNQLTGTFKSNTLTLEGSYPEDGGTTTTKHTLTATSDNTLEGTEDWSWTGGGGSCPGSAASVKATRVN
jgi:hypothetical protein